MATQLDRAHEMFVTLADVVDRCHKSLENVLAEAQNEPPEGQADGSIDAATFYWLHQAELACKMIQRARAALREGASYGDSISGHLDFDDGDPDKIPY